MVGRDRQAAWRQGHVLTGEDAVRLGLITGGEKDKGSMAIVISHDCDIVRNLEVEPDMEVIVGRRIEACDGNLTHAKNPRKLHLSATSQNSPIILELMATAKKNIHKSQFLKYEPDPSIRISMENLFILQRWLAARYRRTAFPDEFDRRLHETGLDKRVAKICGPLGIHLISVFFDIDSGKEVARNASDGPYTLTITLLYSTENDPEEAEEAAEKAADLISESFREKCFSSDKNAWKYIELLECEYIADHVLTYADSQKLKRWNADYISLRVEPAQILPSD